MTGATVWGVILVLGMVAALLTVPLGIPGIWIMTALLLVGVFAGWVSWPVWSALAALALVAELLEFFALGRMGARYGGSRKAFWGAVVGGFLGLFVGTPIPVVGSVVTGLVGTFVGAALVTLHETRSARDASRVGWGMLLARVVAVGLKVAVGLVVLVVGGAAILLP